MKAKELRIGNLVQDKLNKTTYEINVRSLLYLIKCEEAEKEVSIEPIPLNEEWLVKFGFHHYGIGYISEENLLFVYSNGKDKKYEIFLYQSEQEDAYIAHFEYVHQLQNLYFTITGKELTLK